MANKKLEEYSRHIASLPNTDRTVKVYDDLAESIMKGASKTQLMENFGSLSITQIASQSPKSFGALINQHGKDVSKNCAKVLVADLSLSFGGDLNDQQIIEIVDEIHAGMFLNLSLESLYLVCRSIKISNQYGKLTVNKVLSAINDHQRELTNAIANANYSKHLATKFKDDSRSESIAKKNAAGVHQFNLEKFEKSVKENGKI